MRPLLAFISGGLFGLGLMLADMTNTDKVQGWLDFLGEWDPTLAFVLGGAIIPMFFAWRIAERREKPAFGACFPPKPDPIIDTRLVLGSVLFGAGWALVGLCPGPAMASLGYGGTEGLVFFLSMVAGMVLAHAVMRTRPVAI
ncbi:MAG: hypothetical protein D6688_07130 [Alphaproteobacteria bacterium]|nr:MAG: hypothetical protein D6688_07130 [Alphaproteobacteria bacterium]